MSDEHHRAFWRPGTEGRNGRSRTRVRPQRVEQLQPDRRRDGLGQDLGGLDRAHQRARQQQVDRRHEAREAAGCPLPLAGSLTAQGTFVVVGPGDTAFFGNRMADEHEVQFGGHAEPSAAGGLAGLTFGTTS